MENNCQLSIIVPIYNVNDYLENCLQSLINQEIDDYEILLINDGSTDCSQKIIDKYQALYKNTMKSFIKENGGLSDARNFGVAHSKGKYLAFVDSDDYIDRDLFKNALNLAEKKNLDVVAYDFLIEQNGEKRVKKTTYQEEDKYSIFRYSVNACNKMISRKLWLKNNLFFPVGLWYEDLAVIPCLPTLTKKIGFIENSYYHYINRSGSITKQTLYNDKMMDIIPSLRNLETYVNIGANSMYLEFLFINHGLYLSTQNLIKYDKMDECKQVISFIVNKFPLWKKNIYIRELPLTKRIYIWCLSHHLYRICKLLVILRTKVGC